MCVRCCESKEGSKVKRIGLMLGLLCGLCCAAGAQNAPFTAASGLSLSSTIIGNNVTPIQVCKSNCQTYMIDAFNNSTTLAYIKLYNALAANVTCGQTTLLPSWRGMIPYGTSSSGGGFALPNVNGDAWVNGMTMCVTTGIADTDTGAPAAATYLVNIHYKLISP